MFTLYRLYGGFVVCCLIFIIYDEHSSMKRIYVCIVSEREAIKTVLLFSTEHIFLIYLLAAKNRVSRDISITPWRTCFTAIAVPVQYVLGRDMSTNKSARIDGFPAFMAINE